MSESGSSTFQATPISWSTRTRGKVVRSQTAMKTNTYVFRKNQKMPYRVPAKPDSSAGKGHGASQPPKKRATMTALMMNSATYSAKKKNPKRIPEYSVNGPATSSESASIMSNGVRLISASDAM